MRTIVKKTIDTSNNRRVASDFTFSVTIRSHQDERYGELDEAPSDRRRPRSRSARFLAALARGARGVIPVVVAVIAKLIN
jgi:hypothetical protein